MNGYQKYKAKPPNGIPQPSRCFKFKPASELIPKLHKYMFPKSIRLKVIVFLSLVCLTVFILFYLSCFSSTSESSLCGSSNLIPNLSFFGRNKTYRHFPQQSRHLPQCIIIGIRKAGTRALLNYLSIHPHVMTALKEVHFFNIDKNYHQGLEYYRKLMPYSYKEHITIEKTPAYFTEMMVPERVYRMNSTIKLMLIVREPVIRLVSDYTQLRERKISHNKTPIPFESEVLDEDGEVDVSYKPVQTSMYYSHMLRWMEFFSREQIHIVDGERLISDPYSELYKVETFLGLEHRIKRENFFFNETKGFYCLNDAEGLHGCLASTKGRKHPPVDAGLLKKLYKFYAPRNKLFFEFINQTFDWDRLQEQYPDQSS